MKKMYHKSNTFTFSQVKERLVVDGQVQIVEATLEIFKGWGSVMKTFYSKFPSVLFSKATSSAATRQHSQHSV
jgi:hypothetical protein